MHRALAVQVRGEGGQSLVEIALALPLVVLLIVGAADIGAAFAVQLVVQNGARAGAEAMAIASTPTTAAAQAAARAEMSGTPGLDASAATITLTQHNGDFVSACAASPPTYANPCYVTVRVRYTYSTIMTWPGIPTSFSFDRQTTFPRYK